jgi:type I restriction enzyme R subunit
VDHFEKRLDAMDGKAMVVCMSRRICVDLYNEIIRIPRLAQRRRQGRIPQGRHDRLRHRSVEWQQHIRDKRRRNDLATNFKTPESQFKMVIVRDMWLTGFDAPSLHTMYLDKP